MNSMNKAAQFSQLAKAGAQQKGHYRRGLFAAATLLAVLSPAYIAQRSLAQGVIREETTIYRRTENPAIQETNTYRYESTTPLAPAAAPATVAPAAATPVSASVSSDEVNDDPQDFVGRPIAMRGEVDKVYGPNSFRLKDGELVVVTSTPLPSDISNDDKVMIMGELRQATAAEAEQTRPYFSNGPRNTYVNYNADRDYVMSAQEVRIMDND